MGYREIDNLEELPVTDCWVLVANLKLLDPYKTVRRDWHLSW